MESKLIINCMKKLLLKTSLITVLLITISATNPGYSQSLLIENFDYNEGTLLTNVGWNAYCQPGINAITVSMPGLTYPGYALSNIGGAAKLDALGEHVRHSLTIEKCDTQTNDTLYVSFMVSVDKPVCGDFLNLADCSSGARRARVFVNNTNPYKLGLSFGSTTPVYSSDTYTTGTTYLVVLKYDIKAGSSCNDAVSMYVFQGKIPSEEPATPYIGPLTDGSLGDIDPGLLLLRQYSSNQNITVDGIRVGANWLSAVTYDSYAPLFSTGYPSAANIKHNRFDLQVSLNEAGKVFYMVVPAGSPAPAVSEIIAGTAYGETTPVKSGSVDILTEETVYSAAINNLTALTGYDVYTVAQDDEATPNVQSSATLFTVTTLRTPDTSLTDLRVDGVTVAGFTPSLFSYTMIYEAGTTAIPSVSYTLNDPEATAVLTPATDLTGDNVARSAVITVTAYDGETKVTYSVSFDPILQIANLAALRAIPEADFDRVYEVTGEVYATGVNNTGTRFMFVQDNSGAGIYVNDSDNKISTVYSVGNGIKKLCGTLNDYSGMLGLKPYRDPGVKTSSGNLIAKQVVNVSDFIANFESYESELVTINSAAFTKANGSAVFELNVDNEITVGAEKTIARSLFNDSDLTGNVIPYMADISGIASWFNTAAGVSPRTTDDLVIYSSDATISKLVFNRTSLDIIPDTYYYDVSLSSYVVLIPKVLATATSSHATLSVIQATSLTGSISERSATVTVTSQNKAFTNIYAVTFTLLTEKMAAPVEEVELYPVPATTQVTVKKIESVILLELYNATGVKLQTVKCASENEKTLDLSRYPTGIYFIKLTTPEGIEMKKFLIK